MTVTETLAMVVSVLVYGIFVAVFAIGIAFWLSTATTPLPLRRRAAIGAGVGSSILCLVPVAAVVLVGEWSSETMLVLVVMLVAAAFLAAVFGFPAAYLFSKRREEKQTATSPEP